MERKMVNAADKRKTKKRRENEKRRRNERKNLKIATLRKTDIHLKRNV